MKKILLIVIVIVAGLSIAFIPSIAKKFSKKADKSKQDIPELLVRNDMLGSTNEIELTMTTYDNLVDQIESGKKPLDSRLELAALFMQEARITGEHGHYYPAALEMINPVLKNEEITSDMRFQALSLKSSVLLSLHQFEEALPVIQEAISINPYNARIYGALVDVHVEMGNYDEAVKASDKMISIKPDLRSYSRVSYLRELHGDLDGAKEAMEYAAKAGYPGYEESAWCQLNLGNLYEKTGDLEKAKVIYKQALQDRPNYPFAIAALGRIEMKQGNLETAEKLATEAANIIPEFTFYELLAEIYQKTGREKLAKKTLKEVIVGFEEDEAAGHVMNMEYAKLYLHLLDDPDKALTYAMKEYDSRPKNIMVNKLLAEIYFEKEEFDKAAKHIDAALTTGLDDPKLNEISSQMSKS